MGGHGKLVAHLSERSLVAGAPFHTVDADNQARQRHVSGCTQHRYGLTNRCAGSGDVFDNEDSVAGLRHMADEHSAFTVVFGFFAVEHEAHVASTGRQCSGGLDSERDALVRRAKQHIELAKVGLNRVGIELTQAADLRTGSILAGLHEVRRFPAALGGEIAERQNVRLDHKVNEIALVLLH